MRLVKHESNLVSNIESVNHDLPTHTQVLKGMFPFLPFPCTAYLFVRLFRRVFASFAGLRFTFHAALPFWAIIYPTAGRESRFIHKFQWN